MFGFKTHYNLLVNLLCPKHPFQQGIGVEMNNSTAALMLSVVSTEEREHWNRYL